LVSLRVRLTLRANDVDVRMEGQMRHIYGSRTVQIAQFFGLLLQLVTKKLHNSVKFAGFFGLLCDA